MPYRKPLLLLFCLSFILLPLRAVAASPQLDLRNIPTGPLDLYLQYIQETEQTLEPAQALALARQNPSPADRLPDPGLGLDSPPIWIHLKVHNRERHAVRKVLLIENTWLDDIQAYLFHEQQVISRFQGGDRLPFASRSMAQRNFGLPLELPVGSSEILIRVVTTDPRMLPVRLLSPRLNHHEQMLQGYTYGFVYGYLFALILYNIILGLVTLSGSSLSYALYLSSFLLMSFAYSGHGYQWLWPGQPDLQRWIHPLSIILFGASGLLFCDRFLELRRRVPLLYYLALALTGMTLIPLIGALLGESLQLALRTSFIYLGLFTLLLPCLGAVAACKRVPSARYFILAALCGATGTGISTATASGWLSYSALGYRAIDIGMLLEATLLALALADRLRIIQKERQEARHQAETDPLTELPNRRAFYRQCRDLWQTAYLQQQPLSVIIFDIDHFKCLNDRHGHAFGDTVLQIVAATLQEQIRLPDLAARWGGEEFLILLADTRAEETRQIAERLRRRVAELLFQCHAQPVTITISLGITERLSTDGCIDTLIERADQALYQAKAEGRNRTIRR